MSCGYYYKTMTQPPTAVVAVATAPAVFFYPPWFGQLPRPEAYTDDPTWQRDVAQIQAEWLEQVPAYADDEGVASRVFTLPMGMPVPAGAIGVQFTVVGLRDDYSAMSGGFLYLTADLRFVDSSGVILFDSRVEATSKITGPVAWRGMAIDGRIAFASWNLLTVAMRVVRTGRIEPSGE
jgi:hypothetical protein